MSRAREDVVQTPGAVIIGAGIAGLFTALRLAPFPAVILAASPPGFGGASIWAQGGIAAALDADDCWELHAADTISAGARLGDPEIVALVAREAHERIADLVRLGVPFDRGRDGKLALAREAAHSRSRIVHVSGDRAGAEIMMALANAVAATPSISVIEGMHAIELAARDRRVAGVFARPRSGGGVQPTLFRGKAVILASGGIGALYSTTTNPPDSRGEGLGMAARAGALIADPEFVQFHPTAMNVGRDPEPLVTEALRGQGAMLIDERGHQFMQDAHPAGELAPRDVVARAIFREMARGHRVFLDGRRTPGDRFASEFPTVYEACRNAGIDPAREAIPITPAAHYHMGGVATDNHGRSSLPGLWCVGECACTGLHGANRLASNSLLEALVFGARVADDVRAETYEAAFAIDPPSGVCGPPKPLREDFRAAMMRWVGLERDAAGLRSALFSIAASERANADDPAMLNAFAAAKLVSAGALSRRESIGAHFRRDFPVLSDLRQRSFLTLAQAERIAADIEVPDSDLRMVRR